MYIFLHHVYIKLSEKSLFVNKN